MANPNGRKGAQFETDVMRWLRDNNAVAERLTKAGAKDEGLQTTTRQGGGCAHARALMSTRTL